MRRLEPARALAAPLGLLFAVAPLGACTSRGADDGVPSDPGDGGATPDEDAGLADAGGPPDAGAMDGGAPDAGVADGGVDAGVDPDGGAPRYHPAGWILPTAHGRAANLGEDRCTLCHGADLSGGGYADVGCDGCHAEGWRTDCTFCHGGVDDDSGAPPVGIGGPASAFEGHRAHVQETNHAAWDCGECHEVPTDVLSPGHVFVDDATPGLAEVDLGAGLSPAGTWDGEGCGMLYCHGDGAGGLGAAPGAGSFGCTGCHGGAADVGTLSGVHGAHLGEGATCADCHADTASDDTTIATPARHVDGAVDVALGDGMAWDAAAGTCSGSCHGTAHAGSTWAGAFHGDGWSVGAVHGRAANLQTSACVDCHGSALMGGTSGLGCDGCHAEGWRTDCTFCHGGADNLTGAPPVGIDGAATLTAFADHSEHVEDGATHDGWSCEACHVQPTDALSPGHVFVGDTTPGEAEVDMSGGLSDAGTHVVGSTTCGSLYCHGDGAGSLGSATSGATYGCGSCHGSASSASSLSGEHRLHVVSERIACSECHEGTASGSSGIADPSLHVDGRVDVAFDVTGITWSGTTCSGSCHGEEHRSDRW